MGEPVFVPGTQARSLQLLTVGNVSEVDQGFLLVTEHNAEINVVSCSLLFDQVQIPVLESGAKRLRASHLTSTETVLQLHYIGLNI